MALPFVNKTKSGTVLLVVSLTVALGGWFGYTAWKEAAREAGQWRLANEDMQRLLTEQSEKGQLPNGDAGRKENHASSSKSNPANTESKEAGSGSKNPDSTVQPGSGIPDQTNGSQGGELPGNVSGSAAQPAPAPAAAANSSGASSSKESKLNINHATEKELDALPGIGESKAKAIVAYREKIGGRFKSVDQLKEVKGIGDKLLAKMKPYITVEP